VDNVHPTGSVNVQLDKNGAPKFDIISDVAYDYIEFIPDSASFYEPFKSHFFNG